MTIPDLFRIPRSANDIETILRYTLKYNEFLSCEYAVANLICWGDLYELAYTEHDGRLWIYNGAEDYLYFPLGREISPEELQFASQNLRQKNHSGILDQIPYDYYLKHQAQLDSWADYDCDARFWDYVYTVDNLANLAGEKMTKKRNLIHQFEKKYPSYTLHEFDPNEGVPNGLYDFIQTWANGKETQNAGSINEDVEALQKAFSHFKEGRFRGLYIQTQEGIAAFTVWSHYTHNMVDTHFEKALRSFKGGSQMINCQMAKLLQREGQIQYINREQDLGVEGLEHAKRSYYPSHQIKVGYLRPRRS